MFGLLVMSTIKDKFRILNTNNGVKVKLLKIKKGSEFSVPFKFI